MRKISGRGFYHVALVITAVTAFNWALIRLIDVNIVARIFSGFSIPDPIIPIVVCISAILVLWHNWVD